MNEKFTAASCKSSNENPRRGAIFPGSKVHLIILCEQKGTWPGIGIGMLSPDQRSVWTARKAKGKEDCRRYLWVG